MPRKKRADGRFDATAPLADLFSVEDDIEATVFVVMIEAAKSAREDLKATMAGVAQWTEHTPGAGWDVGEVLNHSVGGLRIFTTELTGQDAGRPRGRLARYGAEGAVRPRRGSRSSRVAQARRPVDDRDDLAGCPARPHGGRHPLTEVLVHGADLAVATGQVPLIDQELCAILVATMHGMGDDAYRVPGVFGPEVAAPAGAALHEQLVAFGGRDLQRVSAGVAS